MITSLRSLSPLFRSLSLSKDRPDATSTNPGSVRAWALAVWHELPLLLVINTTFCLALVPAVVAYGTSARPLAPILAALLAGPVWATAVRFGERALGGERTTLRELAGLLRRSVRPGIMITGVPAVAAGAFLATGSLTSLPPALAWTGGLDLIIAVLGLVAMLAGFRLAAAGGRGLRLWLDALTLAGRRPVITLGAVALGVLVVVAATWLPSILVVVPGPLAFFLALVGILLTVEPVERTRSDGL